MSRKLSLYLTDILTSISNIQRYTLELSYEEFTEDQRTLWLTQPDEQAIESCIERFN